MMKRRSASSAVLGIVLIVLLPCTGLANLVNFYVGANADQVVGDVVSPGTGAGWVQLDTSTNTIQWNFIFGNLTGPATGAHFHGPAATGVNAGVQLTLDESSNPIVGSATITASQAEDLMDDLWYIQLHTDANPSGEIRGQVIKVIPEPATTALLGIGAVALLRRRKHV
jgi:hypothetical protein